MGSVVQIRAQDPKGKSESSSGPDETLLIAVMDACREGLAIEDAGYILRANHAFAQLFGYFEAEEVRNRKLVEFVPESLFLFSSAEMRPGVQVAASECVGVRNDGVQTRVFMGFATLQLGGRGLRLLNVRGFVDRARADNAGASRDEGGGRPEVRRPDPRQAESHTESHHPEPRHAESHRLETMGRVVGGVAHDFNNLLTGILLYCDLLLRGLDGASPLRGYVQEIRKAGAHSSGLIQQLLSAASGREEDAGIHFWNEVVSGMHNFLARMLGAQIELVTVFDPGTAPVRMSQTSMRQIVLNLLLNARDSMPEGGQIILAARNMADGAVPSTEHDVEFSISDCGCGMDAETRQRLFDPFFTTKAAGQGHGLGLTTVRRLVVEAGGNLDMESEPGRGTRISIRLPKVESQRTQESSQTQTSRLKEAI